MIRRNLTIILIILNFILLSAEVFLPDYQLPGVSKVVNNRIDIYNLHRGSLYLENRLDLLETVKLITKADINYEERLVKLTLSVNGIEIYPPYYLGLDAYIRESYRSEYKHLAVEMIRQLLEDTERSGDTGIIPEIVIDLPRIALPRAVRKFMGNKAGRLNLDGSQKLTFTGGSTSRKTPQKSENDKSTDFSLQMRQDLNLRLRGTIGEKIHVDVNHHSTSDYAMLSQPNDINISYQGFEDEVVQTIEGGNIALSLSGSKYISYTASSEGLFGVKSEMEAGGLKLTTIVGKDEAKKSTQKYRGDTQADSLNIRSYEFVKRKYFFIEKPETLYELYAEGDPISDSNPNPAPEGWWDNAIKLSEDNEWIVSLQGYQQLPLKPAEGGEVHIYLDDANVANDNDSDIIFGYEIGNENTEYKFKKLVQDTDYLIDYNSGIITFITLISKLYTIGIRYTNNNGEVIGSENSDGTVTVKLIQRSNLSIGSNDNYSALNFYDLRMDNVTPEGFKVDVFTFNSDNSKNFINDDGLTYNEYLRLDTDGDGLVGYYDETIDTNGGYIIFPFIKPFEPLGDVQMYQSDSTPQADDWKFYIAAKGNVGRDQISLNQLNILKGSVKITLKYSAGNSENLKENIDYIVDYDFGIITLLNPDAKDPDNELDISYQFKPLFAIESKTLLGFRADMDITENFKMGGTFVYQSEKVSEEHPQIGSENRSIILADIDGSVELEAPFLTRFVDWFPLIRTDEESSISLSGEVAMSLPRIYGSDKQHDDKEAYIDDMEAILDTYPLGVVRATWSPASRPEDVNFGKAGFYWYKADNIYARDIYDEATLTNKEEKEEVTVMSCKLTPPEIGNPGTDTRYWGGIMKYLGNQLDFNQKKYIEVLLKVDSLATIPNPGPVVMHVDLGDMSEDFYTEFGGEDFLNTEDGKNGGILDGNYQYQEDVGLDGIEDGDEGDDPNDNQEDDSPIIDGEEEWPYLNGSENNGVLDTEDLNGNGALTTNNIYFEFSLPLNDGSSPYLVSEYNGWKQYRIPLEEPEEDLFHIVTDDPEQLPDLEKISFARVWFEVEDRTRIKIVKMDLVGNKWEEMPILDAQTDQLIIDPDENESFLVGVIDNQRNEHYKAPPHTEYKKEGTLQIEQSLTIDYENFENNHLGIARQKFYDQRNRSKGLDLLTYSKLRFWVYSELEEVVGVDSLVFRIGADSLNYYEIRHPIEPQFTLNQLQMDRDGWREIEVDFSEFTYLKALSEYDDVTYEAYKDSFLVRYSKIGRPTLSNVKEIALGLVADEEFNGRIYFNDIRVAEPYEDIGFAAQTNFHTSFADFSTLDIDLKWQTPNFQNSTSRTTSPSYQQKTELGITSKYYLNKFFPAEWGLNMPLTLNRSYSLGIPRFKANSDILREDLPKAEKEREKSESLIYGASFNFSQNKTPPNKILAYTIKNTSISSNIQKKQVLNSTVADTTLSYSITHNYDLDLPKEKLGFKLGSNYSFYFFPNSFDNQIKFKVELPNKWRWETYTDSIPKWVPQTNIKDTKTIDTETNIKYDIFSDLVATYKFTHKRDLMMDGKVFGYDLGMEKGRSQTFTLDYDPNYLENIFAFKTDGKVKYVEDRRTNTSYSNEDEDEFTYEGDVDRDIKVDITFKNRDLLTSWANKINTRKTTDLKNLDEPKERIETEEKEQLPQDDPFQDKESLIRNPENQREEPFRDLERETEMRELEEEASKRELEDRRRTEVDKQDKDGEKITEDPEFEEDTEKEGSVKEDSPGFNVFGKIIEFLTRFENFTFDYNNSYSTRYDTREERPEFVYQLGVPGVLTDEELDLQKFGDGISVNTGVMILSNLSADFSYSLDIDKRYGAQATSGTLDRTTNFPDITLTLTDFEKIIKAENLLTSSRITSSYRVTKVYKENLITNQIQSDNTTLNMQPLASWTGNWINNVTSNLSFNYRTSENITYSSETASSTRNETTYSISGNVSWSFTAARGLKIPFLKKKLALRNELTTDVGFNYEKIYNTKSSVTGTDVEKEKINYSISPGASYKFSQNINAGLDINYNYSHDKLTNFIITNFTLGLWIEIIF